VTTVGPGLLAIFLCVLFAVAGLKLVQRLVPFEVRAAHTDVAGFIYVVMGTVYAVLLAFALIATWQDYETAKATTENEANELAEIYFLADRFSDPEREQVQDLVRAYARAVVEEEWPLMEQRETSPRASALVDELRLSIYDFEPATDAGLVHYDEELTRVRNLAEARRLRLLETREGIPGILWIVLVVGGALTVGFTYLFGLTNTRVHTLMVVALTLMVASLLLTAAIMDYPFSGGFPVSPDAFELVLERFEESNSSDL
jgi:hypothetical protein